MGYGIWDIAGAVGNPISCHHPYGTVNPRRAPTPGFGCHTGCPVITQACTCTTYLILVGWIGASYRSSVAGGVPIVTTGWAAGGWWESGALLEQSLCLPTPFVVMCIGPWQCMPLLLISRFVSAAVCGLTPLALMIGCGERRWCAAVVLHGLCRSDRRRIHCTSTASSLGAPSVPGCMRSLPVGFNSLLCNPVSSLAWHRAQLHCSTYAVCRA